VVAPISSPSRNSNGRSQLVAASTKFAYGAT
jgi:hypothetical protein